ncbi:MAG: hypothetical protein HY438_02205 [DPANN group archaeon]|nr:hypothetical protein [DPANN group archaeon]
MINANEIQFIGMDASAFLPIDFRLALPTPQAWEELAKEHSKLIKNDKIRSLEDRNNVAMRIFRKATNWKIEKEKSWGKSEKTRSAIWNPKKVKEMAKIADWDFKVKKQDLPHYWRAKLFLEECAEFGLGIMFSARRATPDDIKIGHYGLI